MDKALSNRTFQEAVEAILGHEGEYVSAEKAKRTADRGGETRYGISKRAYPDLDIASLTREQAKEIYLRDYWMKLRCDALPPALARLVFDAGVNQGIGDAARFLQRALGVPQDGVIGPATLNAVRRADLATVIDEFCARRMCDYGDVARETWEANKLGWARRLMREHRAALSNILSGPRTGPLDSPESTVPETAQTPSTVPPESVFAHRDEPRPDPSPIRTSGPPDTPAPPTVHTSSLPEGPASKGSGPSPFWGWLRKLFG